MAKWKFYSYDVWGKGADSWVNNVFETDVVLDLSEDPTESEIVNAIYENIGDKVTIDNGSYNENVIYLMIPVVYTDEETGEVLEAEEYYGELRKLVWDIDNETETKEV